MSAREPAPGQLRLVEDFVNTTDGETEELKSPGDLVRWCAEHALTAADCEVDDAALARALAVREALRALLFANNGYPLDPGAVRALDDFAASVPQRLRFDAPGRVTLEPAVGTADAAVARVLTAVYEATLVGTWPRLKACRSETCGWAFYDSSKNHSAAWCSMRVCGNRQKARRYRSRRRDVTA